MHVGAFVQCCHLSLLYSAKSTVCHNFTLYLHGSLFSFPYVGCRLLAHFRDYTQFLVSHNEEDDLCKAHVANVWGVSKNQWDEEYRKINAYGICLQLPPTQNVVEFPYPGCGKLPVMFSATDDSIMQNSNGITSKEYMYALCLKTPFGSWFYCSGMHRVTVHVQEIFNPSMKQYNGSHK